MKQLIYAGLATLALTSTAWAEGSLLGLPVTLQVQTYDTPDEMIFESGIVDAVVSNEREFSIGPGQSQQKLDVVPITLDITENRVKIAYTVPSIGELYKARFNGYVLTFTSTCQALVSARLAPEISDLHMSNKRIRVDGNSLLINVSGMTYLPNSKIGIDIEVADCARPTPASTSGKKSSG